MNRYKNTPKFQTSRGEIYGYWVEPIKAFKTQTYTFKEGDRLDILAQEFLKDDKLWWVTALVNGVLEPLNIPISSVVDVVTEVEFD